MFRLFKALASLGIFQKFQASLFSQNIFQFLKLKDVDEYQPEGGLLKIFVKVVVSGEGFIKINIKTNLRSSCRDPGLAKKNKLSSA